MLELDHVVIAAADLEAAAVVLEERYGLHSVESHTRHTGATALFRRGSSRARSPRGKSRLVDVRIVTITNEL
jgi:hypothetical protein